MNKTQIINTLQKLISDIQKTEAEWQYSGHNFFAHLVTESHGLGESRMWQAKCGLRYTTNDSTIFKEIREMDKCPYCVNRELEGR